MPPAPRQRASRPRRRSSPRPRCACTSSARSPSWRRHGRAASGTAGDRVRAAARRPVHRHAARGLRRRRDQDRGARRRRRDARLGPPAAQRPLACGGRSSPATSAPSRSTCARRRASGSPRSSPPPPTSCSRTSAPARWRSGASAPRTSTRATRSCIYARVSGYGQTGRYAHRPGFASAGEAISGLRYINGYPDQAPPRSRHQPRRHARRAVGVPGHPARADRPPERRRGPGRGREIVDACFAMSESSTLEFEKTGTVRQPTGPRLPRIAPSQRLPLQRREVGRDRRQPRHAVAAAGEAHGPARAGGGRALRHPPRARRARGPARRDHRRLRRRSTRPRSSTRSSTRAASSARRSTPPRTSTRTRTSASASCSCRSRTRSTGRSPCRGWSPS